jgi:hypothetical protein
MPGVAEHAASRPPTSPSKRATRIRCQTRISHPKEKARKTDLLARPSEPILFPRLRIHFADFPYLRCSIRPEAAHLGDLLRLSVRPGSTC